jgi:hypothetical protein
MGDSTDRFQLAIHPPIAGWVQIDVSLGAETHSFLPSYIGDVFNGIIDAAKAIAMAQGHADEPLSFDWQDEPGSWRWRLTPEGDRLTISVETLRNTFALRHDVGPQVFEWTVPTRRFCNTVLRAMDSLVHQMSIERFEEEWRGPYPEAHVESLRNALRRWS